MRFQFTNNTDLPIVVAGPDGPSQTVLKAGETAAFAPATVERLELYILEGGNLHLAARGEGLDSTGISDEHVIGGDRADIDTGGDRADIDTGGDRADIDTGGDRADIDTGGDRADIDTGGDA